MKWIRKISYATGVCASVYLLPTVKGKDIELHRYAAEDHLETGAFGIQESTGEVFTDYTSIDLAVIPGVAFDAEGNRLGRGQGFLRPLTDAVATLQYI